MVVVVLAIAPHVESSHMRSDSQAGGANTVNARGTAGALEAMGFCCAPDPPGVHPVVNRSLADTSTSG